MNVLKIDLKKVDSEVLRQIIAEIRDERADLDSIRMYDRVHNRHNRGRGRSGEETITWAESKKEDRNGS